MPISNLIKSMNRIDGIIVTVTNYTYTPGINNLKYDLSEEQYKDFLIFMAVQVRDTYVDAINRQRYILGSHAWKPLSITYYTWKRKHNLSLKIWEATGTLKNEIKVFKKGNFLAVGFRQTDFYPKSGLQINKIARYMEYGGRKLGRPPSRPLFRPILSYLRKNVSRYYKKYLKELKKSGNQYLYLS